MQQPTRKARQFALPILGLLFVFATISKSVAQSTDISEAPMGWVQFCRDQPAECAGNSHQDRYVILTDRSRSDLITVNKIVNETIIPVSDKDNYGVDEWWTYPDNGKGDCEDYMLLKRKLLIEAGWPRGALLVTITRDRNNEAHSILTVRTDRGDFILDNERDEILLSWTADYRVVKRQAGFNDNIWVSLGMPTASIATSSNNKNKSESSAAAK
jgi:predicted transglutaminase-like cysteine proteinase